MHQELRNNMPILVTSYKLAWLADDANAAAEFIGAIQQMNPSLDAQLSADSLADQNWEM